MTESHACSQQSKRMKCPSANIQIAISFYTVVLQEQKFAPVALKLQT